MVKISYTRIKKTRFFLERAREKKPSRLHSKNGWVENNPIWVILVTQRWVKKGRTQRWVILTQPFGLLCLTQQAGLLFYGLKLLHC